MRKSILARIFKKLPLTWIFTLILSLVFFVVLAMPRLDGGSNVEAEDYNTAGALYQLNFGPNGEQHGFIPTFVTQSRRALTGKGEAIGLSSDGAVQYQYKGGVTGYLAQVGDSFYQTPRGSAIVWAQDQYHKAVNGTTFQTFAYNSNDTDLYYVSGFTALSSTIGLSNWSIQIVDGLFILILIAVAFMILFRQQLGGQAYVTLINSLPSIILSLVLITFSYPISAVFIDLVSIGSNVAYNLIVAAPNAPGYALTQKMPGTSDELGVPKAQESTINDILGTPKPGFIYPTSTTKSGDVDTTEIRKTLQPDDPQMSLWSIFYTSNAQVCGASDFGIAGNPLTLTGSSTGGVQGNKCDFAKYTVPAATVGAFSSTVSTLITALEGVGVVNGFIQLALVLVIITTQFKILKQLFVDYMILSFFPTVSAWVFLMVALPNRTSKTISDFFRILGGSVLNLVIIYACFLLLVVFGYATNDGVKLSGGTTFTLGDSFKQASEVKWLPPMLGYSYGQIVGNEGVDGANSKIIKSLIIVLFFLAIPRIPDEIKAWLEVPELPAVAKGAGQELGAKGKQAAGLFTSAIGSRLGTKFKGGGH